jgi:hypothetical protein
VYRTYANLPEGQEFNYENWCNVVRAGRTMLSGGPIIHLSVDGFYGWRHCNPLRSRYSRSGGMGVESVVPMARLDIVRNGEVVASTQSRSPTRRLNLTEKVGVDRHSWIAARAGGPEYFGYNYPDVWNRGIFSHTSPVYVAVGGEWEMFDLETAQYMLTLIDGDLKYIRNSSRQHPEGHVTHHHGQEDHQAYLERPFYEARAATHKRMHSLGIAH